MILCIGNLINTMSGGEESPEALLGKEGEVFENGLSAASQSKSEYDEAKKFGIQSLAGESSKIKDVLNDAAISWADMDFEESKDPINQPYYKEDRLWKILFEESKRG